MDKRIISSGVPLSKYTPKSTEPRSKQASTLIVERLSKADEEFEAVVENDERLVNRTPVQSKPGWWAIEVCANEVDSILKIFGLLLEMMDGVEGAVINPPMESDVVYEGTTIPLKNSSSDQLAESMFGCY